MVRYKILYDQYWYSTTTKQFSGRVSDGWVGNYPFYRRGAMPIYVSTAADYNLAPLIIVVEHDNEKKKNYNNLKLNNNEHGSSLVCAMSNSRISLFFSRSFTDDCQMVVRVGRAGVLLDPPHRHVHVAQCQA